MLARKIASIQPVTLHALFGGAVADRKLQAYLFFPQQCLNFLPLPQMHGELRELPFIKNFDLLYGIFSISRGKG